jgi:hypothetical protein
MTVASVRTAAPVLTFLPKVSEAAHEKRNKDTDNFLVNSKTWLNTQN